MNPDCENTSLQIAPGKYCPARGKLRCPFRGSLGRYAVLPYCGKYKEILTQGKTKERQIKCALCLANEERGYAEGEAKGRANHA